MKEESVEATEHKNDALNAALGNLNQSSPTPVNDTTEKERPKFDDRVCDTEGADGNATDMALNMKEVSNSQPEVSFDDTLATR